MLMRFGHAGARRSADGGPQGQDNARADPHRRNRGTGIRRPLRRPGQVQGISLSLTVSQVSEAERSFAALADGGQVQMPLAKTFFSPMFGMLADRFGVSWMVYVTP